MKSVAMVNKSCYLSEDSLGISGPRSLRSSSVSLAFILISFMISGKLCLICVNRILVNFEVRFPIPRSDYGIVE